MHKVASPVLNMEIIGGHKLSGGRVSVSGSSNQVTKCIIAALLTNEPVLIKSAPNVNERKITERLFNYLGGEVETLDENTIRLNASGVHQNEIPQEICRENRIAIMSIGPLLHRFKRVRIHALLGGDKIGKRPVDFHINGFKEMGAHVEFDNGFYEISVDDEGLKGCHIVLPFPSVMATESLIISAVLAKGRTIIENAAIEPEIIELVKMLQKMGADIMINANRTYVIKGVARLTGCELRCMPDRNQAVSLAAAALATGGDVLIENISHDPVYSFLNYIQRMGATFRVNSEGLFVKAPEEGRLKAVHIEIETHPGFMTDWQQPFMVLFTQAEGISLLHETIFEDRLSYTKHLTAMGANISLYSCCLGEAECRFRNKNHTHSAAVQGPTPLKSGHFALPTDIRAGMSLVIAGLVAQGRTVLSNIHELDRKYEKLTDKLTAMGAEVALKEATLTEDFLS